jgi:hypothetical protein
MVSIFISTKLKKLYILLKEQDIGECLLHVMKVAYRNFYTFSVEPSLVNENSKDVLFQWLKQGILTEGKASVQLTSSLRQHVL